MIQYTISSTDLHAHVFHVTCTIANPLSDGQCLRMPTWIPGSYMIRDFSKNVIQVTARDVVSGKSVDITKQDKSTWVLGVCDNAVVIEYNVYAWDMSVRAAHLDQTHGYFNGTSVFFAVQGQENQPCEVDIQRPNVTSAENWRVQQR